MYVYKIVHFVQDDSGEKSSTRYEFIYTWAILTRVQAGFTLIETLVAVALLLAAVVGPIALITHALYSAPFSRNDLIAYNLAQEGIELMRAVRDDIVLCNTFGIANLTNLGPRTSNYYEFDALDTTTITCGPGPETITVPKPTQRQAGCTTSLLVTGNGEYTYTSAGIDNTHFTRCVLVCTPPDDTIAPVPCNGVVDGDIPPDDQTDIISTVSWTERGVSKSYRLRDRLYNWR